MAGLFVKQIIVHTRVKRPSKDTQTFTNSENRTQFSTPTLKGTINHIMKVRIVIALILTHKPKLD